MTAVRTLLSVILAAALLGSSLPVVDDTRTARTETTMETTATRVIETAATLAATDDPVPPGTPGASRTLSVTVPKAGLADARVDYLAIGGTPTTSAPTTLTYRISGQPRQTVESQTLLFTGPSPLVLSPGRHVLRFTLVQTSQGLGVRVRLSGSDTRTSRAGNSASTPTLTPTSKPALIHTDQPSPGVRRPTNVQIPAGGQPGP